MHIIAGHIMLYISNWLYFFLNCIVQFLLICMDSLVILNFLF